MEPERARIFDELFQSYTGRSMASVRNLWLAAHRTTVRGRTGVAVRVTKERITRWRKQWFNALYNEFADEMTDAELAHHGLVRRGTRKQRPGRRSRRWR